MMPENRMISLEVKISDVALRNYLRSGLLFDLESKTTSAFPCEARLVDVRFDANGNSIVAIFDYASSEEEDHESSIQKRFLVFETYPFEGLTRIKRMAEEPPVKNQFAAIFTEDDWRLARYREGNVWKAENGKEYGDVQVYLPMPVLPDEIFAASKLDNALIGTLL